LSYPILRAGVIFVLLSAFHLFLYAQVLDAHRGGGLPYIVMHNWHEYGYWHLDGQLITNPGGIDPGEDLVTYRGHRPTVLLIPYLLVELPGATGGDGLLYDFIVIAFTYVAVLSFLGTGPRGLLIASALCLSPAVINNINGLDTIGIPALYGLGVMSFAAGVFTRPETRNSVRAIAFLLVAVYMLVNWPAVFPLGIMLVYLFCKTSDWKKVALYGLIPLLIGVGVVIFSLSVRHAAGTSTDSFWNAYFWGPRGYDGSGMDTGKAFGRIMTVNLISWLPVIVAGLAALLCNGLGEKWRRAPWPLLASLAGLFLLRNHNAHHPWIATCECGLGVLLSLELLTGAKTVASRSVQWTSASLASAFCVVYVIFWLASYKYNTRQNDALHTLVVTQTPRHALIVVADKISPADDRSLEGYEGSFDRKMISLDDWNQHAADLNPYGKEVYVLSHGTVPPNAQFVSQSQVNHDWSDRLMVPLFDFYRSKIARRAPGDRPQFYDQYQLYKL